MDSEDWDALGELRDYQNGIGDDSDFLICECKSLTLETIQQHIDANQLKRLDLNHLMTTLGLGSGCSSCTKSKDSWEKYLRF